MNRWYSAVLLLRSRVGAAWGDEPLVDCHVRLIFAPDAEAAYRRALALGAEAEHSYSNQNGEKVTWEFLGLHDLAELLEAPADGAEVFSWRSSVDSFQAVRKDRLTVFWSEANSNRRASDLLG